LITARLRDSGRRREKRDDTCNRKAIPQTFHRPEHSFVLCMADTSMCRHSRRYEDRTDRSASPVRRPSYHGNTNAATNYSVPAVLISQGRATPKHLSSPAGEFLPQAQLGPMRALISALKALSRR
jgi:hypothetical protein